MHPTSDRAKRRRYRGEKSSPTKSHVFLPARREKPRGLSLFQDVGLNFKLDVGTLRLCQQVACQRYRQPITDAKTSTAFGRVKSTVAAIKAMNLTPSFNEAPALV